MDLNELAQNGADRAGRSLGEENYDDDRIGT